MATTPAFSPRPITRKTASSFRRDLVPSLSQDDKTFERRVEQSNFQYLMAVAEHYRLEGGKWNAASRFLFRCLTDALDLEAYEDLIVRAVTAQARAKKENGIGRAHLVLHKQKRNSVGEIEKLLKRGGMIYVLFSFLSTPKQLVAPADTNCGESPWFGRDLADTASQWIGTG